VVKQELVRQCIVKVYGVLPSVRAYDDCAGSQEIVKARQQWCEVSHACALLQSCRLTGDCKSSLAVVQDNRKHSSPTDIQAYHKLYGSIDVYRSQSLTTQEI